MFLKVDVKGTPRIGRVAARAALLVSGMALAGCINTATYGTGEAPELTVIKGATGGLTGMSGKGKDEIDYKPRAPLVMPPEKNLRPPVVAAAEADPDWPVEADASGTEQEDPLGETSRDDPAYRHSLKPIAGALPADQRPASYDMEKDSARAHVDAINEREARKKFAAALADAEGYNGEGRRYLTDPPEAYREPADTAPQEFEEIEPSKGSGFAKLFNWMSGPK